MDRRFAVPALVLALSATPILTGCQSVQSFISPTPTVITQEATVAVTAAAVTGELPAETPESLPLWPGAEVASAESIESQFSLVLTSSEPFDDVVSGMTVGFERAGWEVAESASDESATSLDVSNGEYEGVVTVYDAGSATRIEYLIAQ